MRPTRTRAFDREIRAVSTVAEAAAGNLQLSLDEQLPRQNHGWLAIIPHEYGYTAECACGWRSKEVAEKRSAQHELRAHIARTPQGQVLMRTLRRVGRAGSGA